MVERGDRGAEQQARERAHWRIGPGAARALLWVFLPRKLDIVRKRNTVAPALVAFEPLCAWHELRRQASRNSATRRHKPRCLVQLWLPIGPAGARRQILSASHSAAARAVTKSPGTPARTGSSNGVLARDRTTALCLLPQAPRVPAARCAG